MATLILVDERSLSGGSPLPLFGSRPGFVAVESVVSADDACTRVLAHRPEVVVIAGAPPGREMCSAVARVAAAEARTRVVYVSAYESAGDAAMPGLPGVSAILMRESNFADVLSTLLVVLHGGAFLGGLAPPAAEPAVAVGNFGLSQRECEVLRGIASGQTTKVMARAMAVSPKTVETYRNRLMQKLGLRCAAELVRFAVRNRLD